MSDSECLDQMRKTCDRIAGDMVAPPMVLADDPTIIMQDNEAPCGDGYTFDDDSEVWLDSDGDEVETCLQSAFDYLSDVLDIEYHVSGDRTYRGAEVLVAFGGPNIWIDTKTKHVRGAWWGDTCAVPYTDNIGLDDALEELWDI